MNTFLNIEELHCGFECSAVFLVNGARGTGNRSRLIGTGVTKFLLNGKNNGTDDESQNDERDEPTAAPSFGPRFFSHFYLFIC